ncbi:MAG: helix-turn-helix domain-containing protein, partial [Pontiellaceae bacterium]|nr:helix-turn-helix domain-containing protein [Pontiellaceae bacterium]
EEIMQIVTHPLNGLFPHPNEIRFNCNCPDWADMCKHVAASMYGIAVRLDTQPELLFKLRGVNHEELIAVDTAVADLTSGSRSRRRRTLGSDAIGDVFGIDLDQELSAPAEEIPTPPPAPPTFKPTAKSIRSLRDHLGLSRAEFAQELGVSAPSVAKWETTRGRLNLHARSHEKLSALHQKTYSA